MANALDPVAFCAELLPEVRHFDYGAEPWEKDLALWMLDESVAAMQSGTKVWLYLNQTGDCVGYGSLGLRNWSYPTKKSPKVSVLVIPAVAIRTEFKGQPKVDRSDDPRVDGRYSSQIIRHLLDTAFQWPGTIPAVGLFVDPRNTPAIKLYQRFGFEKFDPPYTDKTTGVVYDRYAIRRA